MLIEEVNSRNTTNHRSSLI